MRDGELDGDSFVLRCAQMEARRSGWNN